MAYQDLLVYRLATTIFDATVKFCQRFLPESRFRRTVEQMTQAARSGKQNIVEGSLEKSVEGNLKLVGIARASFGELREDFLDFLRQRNHPVWPKGDPRIIKIRLFREELGKETNLTNLSNWSNLNLSQAEDFANLMNCLIFKETYLLDRLLKAIEEKFIREGGFRENLFRKREQFRKSF